MAIALRYAARSDIGLGRVTTTRTPATPARTCSSSPTAWAGTPAATSPARVAVGRLVALDGESHGADPLALLAQTPARGQRRSCADARHERPVAGRHGHDRHRAAARRQQARPGAHRRLARLPAARRRAHPDHPRPHVRADAWSTRAGSRAEEAEHHPQRSVRHPGARRGDPDDEPDLSVREARVGDRYLICSDGLTDVVRDADDAETLAEHDDPADAADALVAAGAARRRAATTSPASSPTSSTSVASRPLGTTTPRSSAAAAVHGTVASSAAASTPAAKAAAARARDRRPGGGPDHDDDPARPSPRRRPRSAGRCARCWPSSCWRCSPAAAWPPTRGASTSTTSASTAAASRSSAGCPRTSARCGCPASTSGPDVQVATLPEYSRQGEQLSDKIHRHRPAPTPASSERRRPRAPRPAATGGRRADRQLPGCRLMSTITTLAPRTRRGVELVLLVLRHRDRAGRLRQHRAVDHRHAAVRACSATAAAWWC